MDEAYSDQAILHVDLRALASNWKTLKAQASSDIGATVKANAYGLGVGRVSKALAEAGCQMFFVATLSEGLELRGLQPDAKIFVFSGVGAPDIKAFKNAALTPVLNSLEEVLLWAGASPGPGAALHVDTGMNRLGCTASDADTLARQPELIKRAGIETLISHLACADTPGHPMNAEQQARFDTFAQMFPQLKPSLSNSAGTLNHVLGANLARPGIGLYGGNPRPAMEMSLEPVIQLTAPVLQTRAIAKGSSVGYGADFIAPQPMSVATLGIGYGDGLLRSIAGKAGVYIGDQLCPMLGRISMDSIVIDLGDTPLPARGAQAQIIGRTSINTMASWAGTISYEILTSLGPRIKRRY